MKQTIAILGMGLIGTSLGLALHSPEATDLPLGNSHIVGYDQNPDATRVARARLAIDQRAGSIAEAVRDAQIVVIATPVQAVRMVFLQLAPHLQERDGTIVTDVASTKEQVCRWAAELLPDGVAFVGGHPMAGREQAGPEAAIPDLFRGAIYCLTPGPTTSQHAVDTVELLVKAVGARPYYLDPQEHDGYVAGISHLPFVLSTALVEVVGRSAGWKEMSTLAASGFRDLSRLASGDAVMHRDICLTNRTALTRWLNETIGFLLEMRQHLENEDADQIEALFQQARELRETWLTSRPGVRSGEEAFQPPSLPEYPTFFGLRLPWKRRKR
jgi:prephenate dehydrogenase